MRALQRRRIRLWQADVGTARLFYVPLDGSSVAVAWYTSSAPSGGRHRGWLGRSPPTRCTGVTDAPSAYFLIATYLLFALYLGRKPDPRLFTPLVLLSIPWAIGIHTVTAFLYNGLAGRPFWNSAILAPRFLASAFCSGPAVLLVALQLLRRFTRFEIQDAAIWKVAELMAYAMGVNLFLLGAEVFKEYYSATEHLAHMRYMFTGIDGHDSIVPYMWASVVCSILAFLLFLVPATRRNPLTLNLGCALIWIGVYIEKGMGLIIPGLTPDTLGEIYEYFPSRTELWVSMGIFSIGFLLFTLMTKVATPILLGEFRIAEGAAVPSARKVLGGALP